MEPTHKTGDSEHVAAAREQTEVLSRWIDGLMKEQRQARRWKIIMRLLMLVVLVTFLLFYTLLLFKGASIFPGKDTTIEQPHIAVINVTGQITSDGHSSADRIITGIRSAFKAEAAVAVALRINSPGGSPVQSQRVYQELMRLKAESQTDARASKHVYAVIEDIGASGAYYIASAADTIVVSPSSLVGSIGVIQAGFGFQGALQTLGIERRVFTAGENKAFLDSFQQISPDQKAFWHNVLENVHERFIADVKTGRGDTLSGDPDLFSGLVWSGEQAIELGLADRIGDTSWVSRELLNGEHHLVDYTPQGSLLNRVTRRLGVSMALALGISGAQSPVMMLPR